MLAITASADISVNKEISTTKKQEDKNNVVIGVTQKAENTDQLKLVANHSKEINSADKTTDQTSTNKIHNNKVIEKDKLQKKSKDNEDKLNDSDYTKIFDALAWPVVVLIVLIVLIILFSSDTAASKLSNIFKPFKSVKLFAAEFVLSEEAKSSTEGILTKYKKQVKEQFDKWIQRKNLTFSFHAVIQEDIHEFFAVHNIDKSSFRFTIHVPDLLVENTLYQLLDYYPKGKGAGRVKSIRFGIIGKAWRLQQSQVNANVSTDETNLITDWGMTKKEVEESGAGSRNISHAAIILKDKSIPLGVFYIDAPLSNAFNDPRNYNSDVSKQLIQKVEEACKTKGVIEILSKLSEELRGKAPLIKLYD